MDHQNGQYSTVRGNPLGGACQADESASRIRDGFTITEGLLADLHECISLLEKRLDTVLTPTPPQPSVSENGKASSTPLSSHLWQRVHQANEHFACAIQRLRIVTGRVEV